MLNISISPTPSRPSKRPATHRHRLVAAASVLTLPALAFASPANVPHEFESGTAILAEDFNDNFSALAEAIDDNDERLGTLEGSVTSAPLGAVMFFNLEECPSGWSELEDARGRTIVGVNGTAGTLLGETGIPLDDLQERVHFHTIAAGASATASAASVPHSHGAGDLEVTTAGSHNHQWKDGLNTYGSSGAPSSPIPPVPFGGGTIITATLPQNTDYFTSNEGSHSHNITGTSSPASPTGHSHTVNLAGQTIAGNNGALPYLQLLVCQRS